MTSGANSAVSPRSTKSAGLRRPRREPLEIGERRRYARDLDAREERRRASRRPAARARTARSAARRPRGCAAPESSRPAGRTPRRRRSAPPPTITKYCGTARPPSAPHAALEADRRDVVLAAAVRAAADLDARAAAAAIRSRPRAQVLVEQPAEPARLRDREPARLGARAARHVGDRARLGQAEPRGREPAVELPDVGRT